MTHKYNEDNKMKQLNLLLLFVLMFFGFNLILAQTPTPVPTPKDDDVVKITTTLIQIDVTVTDKNGKQIKDLKPEDFEILENNEKQEITNFSYITVAPEEKVVTTTETKPKDPLAPPLPVTLSPEKVRRTIALVVDDLGLSASSIYFVRKALKKFVDEQMQPTDLVAIFRTGSSIGTLQQFTSDKRLLYGAIERVRWNPLGRGGFTPFEPINSGPAGTTETETDETTSFSAIDNSTLSQLRTDIFTNGTLSTLNYVVQGMGELPGRKAVMLFSDGFPIFLNDPQNPELISADGRILDALRRLIEAANRAAVVVNTIDARGLAITGITAADDVSGLSFEQIRQAVSSRNSELFNTQQGLQFLASETGGRIFKNNNDITGAVKKILEDQNGYYLIGYQPDSETFDPKTRRFNKLVVRVKRPGLKARYRSGFFGVTDDKINLASTSTPNPRQKLMNAVFSPFVQNEIELHLASVFSNTVKENSLIQSFIHIPSKDLKFVDDIDGWKKINLDIAAFTIGDNGVPIDQVTKTFNLRLKGETLKYVQENGIVFYLDIPVKKPGAYQFRLALRDINSEKVGSVGKFIEVPNLKKERLSLSGIVLKNYTVAQWQKISQGQSLNPSQSEDVTTNVRMDTALRQFRQGTVMSFGYVIYNAKLDNAKHPNLETQTRIFRDGKQIFAGTPKPVDIEGQTDLTRIKTQGAIGLPQKMSPGDYVFQIIVTDKLAKQKYQVSTQFVEFEIIE